MTPVASAHDRRQRRMLVALAAFFFAPLAVSFYLYYGAGGWRPARSVNHGDLITPARPLPQAALSIARPAGGSPPPPGPATGMQPLTTSPGFLQGKWTLLYWGAGTCAARCRTDLYNTRQVRTALNRDMDRVQRVFVAAGECCEWSYIAREHPDLITVEQTEAAAPLLALLPAVEGVDPATADRIYLIDPLGNLMMSYAPDAKPKGLLEDLKRLLNLSQVG